MLTFLMLFSAMSVMGVQAAEEAVNLVTNGGFETVRNGWPLGWSPNGGEGTYLTMDSEAAYEGSYSAHISVSDGTWHHFSYGLSGLVPRATYRLSAYVRTNSAAATFVLKCRIPTGEQEKFAGYFANTNGEFVKQTFDFTVPENCTSASLLLRQFGNGDTWYDNVEVTLLNGPELFAIDSFEIGDVFHYPHEKTGYAWVHMASYYWEREESTEAKVDFELLDGTRVLCSQPDTPYIDGTAEFTYDISLMKRKKKAYVVRATARYQDQTRVYTQNVYVYDRPSIIRDNGAFCIEGEIFNPVMGYHVTDNEASFKKVAEAGINVIQFGMGGGQNYTEAYLQQCDNLLADMDKYGIKALFVLYDGGVAASERNYEYTKAFVERFKNDPRIFAWAVCDEPFDGTYNPEMRSLMEESYKLVRNIDSMHPVHLTNVVAETPKFCDVYTIDAYPYSADTKGVTNLCRTLKSQHKGEVVWQYMGQTFTTASDAASLPSVTSIRSSMYRALEEGMHGIGYYSINDAVSAPPGGSDTPLYNTDRWAPLCLFGKQEIPVIFDIFVHDKYALLNEYQEGNVATGTYWSTWTDGEVVYAIAHNKSMQEKTMTVPLQSRNGGLTVGNYTLEKVGATESLPSGTRSLQVTLAPQDVALYKITPDTPLDLSLIDNTNLFQNGNFELFDETGKPDFWSVESGVEYSAEKRCYVNETNTFGLVEDGTGHALKFDIKTSGAYLYVLQNVPLAAGNYRLSFRFKAEDKTQYPAIRMYGLDGEVKSFLAVGAEDEWTRYDYYFTVPQTTLSPRIGNYMPNGVCYMDDIVLAEDNETDVAFCKNFVSLNSEPKHDKYTPISKVSEIGEVNGKASVVAKVRYAPEDTPSEKVTMVSCVYIHKNGAKELATMSVCDGGSVTGSVSKTLSDTITIPASALSESYTVETFLWDTISGMKPLYGETILK